MVDIAKTSMARLWANQGDIVSPTDEKIEEGWGIEPVPRQWWNWMQNRVDKNVAYLLQKGIPEWDATTEYIINKSYVQRQNTVFKCIKTNTNRDPLAGDEYWVKAFATASNALDAISALEPVGNVFPYFTGANTAALSALTPLARTLLAQSTAAQMRSTISAQQDNPNLTALAGVPTAINALPYFTGQSQAATTTLTAYARSLLDDDTPASARDTLGLRSMAVQDSTNVAITGGTISGISPIAIASGGTGASTVNAARTNLGLGTVATRDATTSSTDTVSGRVLLTGHAGLGSNGIVIATSEDLNNLTTTGFYGQTSNAAATSGLNYPEAVAGTLLVESAGTGITGQTYTVAATGERYQRTRYLNSWSNWRKVFDSRNVSSYLQSLLTLNDDTAFRVATGTNNANNITTGVLAVARGGTGATQNTGTGRNVLNTSPEFLGIPTAPTPPTGTKNQQIATTAFVLDNVSANPIGTVIQTAATNAPTGYLKCNGANVSRTTYAALFAEIGTRFGVGDGTTTFTLPDLRGEFIRGWDDGRGIDSGRALGSSQAGQNAAHTHTGSTNADGSHSHSAGASSSGNHRHSISKNGDRSSGAMGNLVYGDENYYPGRTEYTNYDGTHTHTISVGTAGSHTHSLSIGSSGGNEARPRNVALMFCIKF